MALKQLLKVSAIAAVFAASGMLTPKSLLRLVLVL